MNLERLRAVQVEEREADSLRPLPDSFYREVAEYIEELRRRRSSAAADAEDPFGSEEVRKLTDEIETAEEVAEAVYERRVGKLVKRASLAAAGMPADEEGLTTEEAELFADLVAQIEAHRSAVLASFDGEAGDEGGQETPGEPTEATGASQRVPDDDGDNAGSTPNGGATAADVSAEPTPVGRSSGSGDSLPSNDSPPSDDSLPEDRAPNSPGTATDEASVVGDRGGTSADDDAEESTDGVGAIGETERVTLRITRDVGEVFGVDERVYDLASEDVVTLPAANAQPLLDRDAAEEID